MPRTAVTVQTPTENTPINGLTFAAMDVANGNVINDYQGNETIIVRNDGGSAYTFTQGTKTDAAFGRDASAAQKTQSIGAGAYLYVSPRDYTRWNGDLDGENASLLIAVIRNPN